MQIDPDLFQDNERTQPSDSDRQYATIGAMQLESGARLDNVVVAYETWGQLTAQQDNAILVCHALTGDSHAIGWWSRLVGPGKPIDTSRFFVICANVLGGCQGSTGPSSLHSDGKPFGSRFPLVTVGDMVRAQKRLVEQLGIARLFAIAGGSMGGMLATDWTLRFPGSVQKAFVTASCAAHGAMQIAFNEAARQSIMRDPNWNNGDYLPGKGPAAGLTVSRMIGHISFLSEEAFTRKFDRRLRNKNQFDFNLGHEFEVESYLNYQGDKFANRFDANSLLVVTRAIDYFEIKTLHGSRSEYLFASYNSDWLYPTAQSRALHSMALAAGCQSKHMEIDLPFGHDAFLLDEEIQGAALREFLA